MKPSKGTANPGQSGSGSNGNERVRYIFRTGVLASDSLVQHSENLLEGGFY